MEDRFVLSAGRALDAGFLGQIGRCVVAAAILALVQGCMVWHHYEGYKGRVIEKETGQPIPGAGVFVKYYKQSPSVGGDVRHFVGVASTLTDEKGEFKISANNILSGRYLFSWFDDPPNFSVYAAGHAVYPHHTESSAAIGSEVLQAPISKEYMTISIGRLQTIDAIRDNLVNTFYIKDSIPTNDAAMKALSRLMAIDEEYIRRGR
jgi:hypothetical protein